MISIKSTPLSEAIELVIDYRGKTPKKLGGDWSTSGYRALSAKNIKTGSIVQPETIRYVDEDLYKKWMKDEVQRGDILITSEAPFGQIYYWDSDEKIVLSQRIFALRTKKEFCSKYLYYYMTTPEFQAELDARATGTTVIGLRQPELLKCKIKYPPVEMQKKIAGVLGALDDKIELNNKINQNLELQAQALFKNIYSSENNSVLADIVSVVETGNRPKGGALDNGIPSIGAENIEKFGVYDYSKEKFIDIDFYNKMKRGKVLSGDVLLYKDGAYTGKVSLSLDDFPHRVSAVNEHVFIIRSKNKVASQFFLYFCLSDEKNKRYLHTLASSKAAQPGLNQTELLGLPIYLPRQDIIQNFTQTISPMMHMIARNAKENQKLSLLRDTLLPKLMSGEINVDNVDICSNNHQTNGELSEC